MKIPIAIVGGGPAGAYLGYCLAKRGIKATIFDDSHPREKPCGGGVTATAMKKFVFLRELYYEDSDDKLRVISPKGRAALVTGEEQTMALSRKRLDMFILERAINAGSNLVEERVLDFEKAPTGWKIRTNRRIYGADILVGADGANSLVRRKLVGPITKENLGVCYGCFARSPRHAGETTTIRFLKGMEGYAWLFPRENDLSIGAGVEAKNGRFVREQFQLFMKRHASHVKPFSYWAAILPTPKDPKFFSLPTSGSDWLLAGDAAGHVDTLTGAGIPYALWGAELAADAIASGDVRSYERLWRKEYSSLLLESIKMRRLFSNSFFLETFIGLSSKSETLGNILCGLFDNEQDYLTVGKDFARKLPRILAELV